MIQRAKTQPCAREHPLESPQAIPASHPAHSQNGLVHHKETRLGFSVKPCFAGFGQYFAFFGLAYANNHRDPIHPRRQSNILSQTSCRVVFNTAMTSDYSTNNCSNEKAQHLQHVRFHPQFHHGWSSTKPCPVSYHLTRMSRVGVSAPRLTDCFCSMRATKAHAVSIG